MQVLFAVQIVDFVMIAVERIPVIVLPELVYIVLLMLVVSAFLQYL